MSEDPFIAAGNEEDLDDFVKNFFPHDRVTLKRTFKMACKKNQMMAVRRSAFEPIKMQVIRVPYSLAEKRVGCVKQSGLGNS